MARDARPDFRCTSSGRPTRPIAIRDELLVKLRAVDAGDLEAAAAAVRERLEHTRSKLERYDRLRERMLNGRSERDFLESAERIGPYLTLMRGRSFETENARWMEDVLEILAARAKRRPENLVGSTGGRRIAGGA